MRKVCATLLLSQLPISARIHYGTAFASAITFDARGEENARNQIELIDVTVGDLLQRIEAGETILDINIKSISF